MRGPASVNSGQQLKKTLDLNLWPPHTNLLHLSALVHLCAVTGTYIQTYIKHTYRHTYGKWGVEQRPAQLHHCEALKSTPQGMGDLRFQRTPLQPAEGPLTSHCDSGRRLDRVRNGRGGRCTVRSPLTEAFCRKGYTGTCAAPSSRPEIQLQF